jgi:hypothetical protein
LGEEKDKMKTIVPCVMFAAALIVNAYLLFIVSDGKRLVQSVEAKAGHELTGYQLYSEHREVNDYYCPPVSGTPGHRLRGALLYWFFHPFLFFPWILLSLGASLLCVRYLRTFKAIRYVLAGLVILLVILMLSHYQTIWKIGYALE